MSAHTGRCFRAWRRLVARRAKHGIRLTIPVRQKVPLALRPFLNAVDNRQVRAGFDQMQLALVKYAQHQAMIGHRPQGR